jgi:sulfatase maturation enzyme AslB (radical SAM superfamily)
MHFSTVHDCSDIYSKKRLNLSALSDSSSFYAFEIDFSNSCNLNCVYCYKKDKSDEHLSKKVAFDALVWGLRAAIPHKRIAIALIGGEPLLNFPLIKEWVPFAVRRTQQEGMSISISVTTNCTLISDEVVDFFKNGIYDFIHPLMVFLMYKI